MKNGLTKDEAKLFLEGSKRRGRKPKYDWAKIIHRLMAGGSPTEVAKEYKIRPAYLSYGTRKYAKQVLAAK